MSLMMNDDRNGNESLQTNEIVVGNAREKDWENNQRGWFIGHFVDPSFGLRCTNDLEVKWGEHKPGEQRAVPGISQYATTLTLLIRGTFVVDFPDQGKSFLLSTMGDYVIFGPGVSHTWKAIEDSIVLTVRWPSRENEQSSDT